MKRIQGRIRVLLAQHAKEVQCTENSTTNTFGFEFVHKASKRAIVVRMGIPIWPQGEPWYARGHEARVVLEKAQRERQVWLLLHSYLKAHLNAVEHGLWSFEDAFLANIVIRDGRTLGEVVCQQVEGGSIALAAETNSRLSAPEGGGET